MFITFEGNNGVGKTTQILLLRDYLEKNGAKVLISREPGGTEIAEKIRSILRSNDVDKTTELLLLFAARNEHFKRFIQPNLDAGRTILCDRFYDSSLVFQGVMNGIDIEQIMLLKEMVLGDFEPDLTFILDLSYESAARRVTERGESGDKYDFIQKEKFELMRNAYKRLAKIFSDRCVIIKGNAPQNSVHEAIINKYAESIRS